MNLYESIKGNLKESDEQYYSVVCYINNKPYYLDKFGTFVSEESGALNSYSKEKAEEILNKCEEYNVNNFKYEIVPVDYKPTQEELDKLYEQLEELNKEYDSEKGYSTSADGSLGMISTQIYQVEKQIDELKKELNK